MKITLKAKKGVMFLSNDNLFSYSWFIGVKTVDESNTYGRGYYKHSKKNHKFFFLAILEKSIKCCPGGYFLL